MIYLINNNGTLPTDDMFPFNEIATARRWVIDFFITLLQIYWTLFVKFLTIAAEKYTDVFGDNHYHAIFTVLVLIWVADKLINRYNKRTYYWNELIDQFFYLKQKVKYREDEMTLLFNALESTEKKFKTMEAKIKKLEKELKKYD